MSIDISPDFLVWSALCFIAGVFAGIGWGHASANERRRVNDRPH